MTTEDDALEAEFSRSQEESVKASSEFRRRIRAETDRLQNLFNASIQLRRLCESIPDKRAAGFKDELVSACMGLGTAINAGGWNRESERAGLPRNAIHVDHVVENDRWLAKVTYENGSVAIARSGRELGDGSGGVVLKKTALGWLKNPLVDSPPHCTPSIYVSERARLVLEAAVNEDEKRVRGLIEARIEQQHEQHFLECLGYFHLKQIFEEENISDEKLLACGWLNLGEFSSERSDDRLREETDTGISETNKNDSPGRSFEEWTDWIAPKNARNWFDIDSSQGWTNFANKHRREGLIKSKPGTNHREVRIHSSLFFKYQKQFPQKRS